MATETTKNKTRRQTAFLSISDLMARYHISRSTAWRLASEGYFGTPRYGIAFRGTRWLVNVEELDRKLLKDFTC